MKIPSYQRFISPLLAYLGSDGEPHKTTDVYKGVADAVGLTEEDKAQLLPSGLQAVYKKPPWLGPGRD